MKLSIVIPLKNAEKYLDETLDSILGQKGSFNLEVLVEHGKSTDTTGIILERYVNEFRSKGIEFRVNEEEDKNMYEAVVRGLSKASGEIVTWISGTDFYLPNAFSTVMDIFGNNDQINWVTGVPMSFNDKGQNVYTKLPIAYHRKLIQQGFYNGKFLHFIQQESTFIRKKAVEEIELSDMINFPHAGDQKLWQMLSQKNELYIANTHLSGSRMHENRVSSNPKYGKELDEIADEKQLGTNIQAVLQYFATYFFPEKLKRMLAKNFLEYKNNKWES